MSLALSNGGTFLLMVSKNTGGVGVEMGHFVMAHWVCALRVLLGGVGDPWHRLMALLAIYFVYKNKQTLFT